MHRAFLIAVLVLALFGPAARVCADSVSARMDVSALVPANCRITVPALSFGTYDPLQENAAKPADASAVLVLICTRNTAATLSFDLGLHAGGGADRGMAGAGVDLLRYDIFRDSARSLTWRNGGDSLRIISTGLEQSRELTVFGRIPPRQDVEPGSYNDVLTAVVDF